MTEPLTAEELAEMRLHGFADKHEIKKVLDLAEDAQRLRAAIERHKKLWRDGFDLNIHSRELWEALKSCD